MRLGDKQDLDALLRDWPALPPGAAARTVDGAAPEDEDAVWDARADAIVLAATAAARSDDAVLAALVDVPALPAEPGEGEAAPAERIAAPEPVKESAGEKKMSQENESGGPPTSADEPKPSAQPAERKRTSLKDIAARASQSGARLSSPGAAPARSSLSTPIPSTTTPIPAARPSAATPLPKPVEAGREDSGIVNLNVVKASATPQEVAAAEKAKPASEGLFDEEKPAAAAAAKPIAAPAPAKKSNGPIIGVGIAVLGLAAAFAIMQRKPDAPPSATPEAKPAIVTEAKPAPKPEAPAPTAAPTAEAVASAEPSASGEPAATEAPKVAAGPSGAGPAATAAPAKDDGKLAQATKPGAATGGKPGDLQSEMAKAVGADGQPKAASGVPEPAAGNPKTQNIPEQPSQGSVQSAIGAVLGGAKACVAGGADISRAQVTFSSNGSVSSVSVTGWAAANGKSGCVQAALKGAKVGPFSKPSFTVGVPIRP